MSISTADILADFNRRRNSSSLSRSQPMLKQFKNWLKAKKLSAKTIKNYASDVGQFLNYLNRKRSDLSKALPTGVDDFHSYILKLQAKKASHSTINRKLASLRRFCVFLHHTYSIDDFSDQLANIPADPVENLLKNFRYYLVRKGHKSKTITNYLSDIKHYLTWAVAQSKSHNSHQ